MLADEERGWFDRLADYESDPFGLLVIKLKEIQAQKKVTKLSQDDLAALDELRRTRNYWAHQCFGGNMPIVFRKGEVRDSKDAIKITSDLNDAIEWDRKLTEIMRSLAHRKS